jgi:hypothetical protein
MKMVCTSFKPLRKNTLLGFCEIHILELDAMIKDIAIHEKNGSRWAAPPARPQISKDGAVIRDDRFQFAPSWSWHEPLLARDQGALAFEAGEKYLHALTVNCPGLLEPG